MASSAERQSRIRAAEQALGIERERQDFLRGVNWRGLEKSIQMVGKEIEHFQQVIDLRKEFSTQAGFAAIPTDFLDRPAVTRDGRIVSMREVLDIIGIVGANVTQLTYDLVRMQMLRETLTDLETYSTAMIEARQLQLVRAEQAVTDAKRLQWSSGTSTRGPCGGCMLGGDHTCGRY